MRRLPGTILAGAFLAAALAGCLVVDAAPVACVDSELTSSPRIVARGAPATFTATFENCGDVPVEVGDHTVCNQGAWILAAWDAAVFRLPAPPRTTSNGPPGCGLLAYRELHVLAPGERLVVEASWDGTFGGGEDSPWTKAGMSEPFPAGAYEVRAELVLPFEVLAPPNPFEPDRWLDPGLYRNATRSLPIEVHSPRR